MHLPSRKSDVKWLRNEGSNLAQFICSYLQKMSECFANSLKLLGINEFTHVYCARFWTKVLGMTIKVGQAAPVYLGRKLPEPFYLEWESLISLQNIDVDYLNLFWAGAVRLSIFGVETPKSPLNKGRD
jgi:hypothetical protein